MGSRHGVARLRWSAAAIALLAVVAAAPGCRDDARDVERARRCYQVLDARCVRERSRGPEAHPAACDATRTLSRILKQDYLPEVCDLATELVDAGADSAQVLERLGRRIAELDGR